LLRAVRMKVVLELFEERIQSDKLSLILSILKIFFFVLCFGHITGCMWWGLGVRRGNGETWTETTQYNEKPLDWQYIICLHWALAQLGGGMDEVVPANASERLYVVAHYMVSYMITAFILSIVTSRLTQTHILQGAQARSMSVLRKYLTQNGIPGDLAMRVQRSAQHALSGEISADTVELLHFVSEPLQKEVSFGMYMPSLKHHVFFEKYCASHRHAMRQICHSAMQTLLLAPGDPAFFHGDEPERPQMYFVCKGSLEYSGETDVITVAERQVVAEPALWVQDWKHRGSLVALTEAKLAVLDARLFRGIVNQFSSLENESEDSIDVKQLASEFVMAMNKALNVTDMFCFADVGNETMEVKNSMGKTNSMLSGKPSETPNFLRRLSAG